LTEQAFAIGHILEAVYAAQADVSNENDAKRLYAETKLRLMAMSEETIWELARLTSSPPIRPAELAYDQIKRAIKEHEATAIEWLGDLYTPTPLDRSGESDVT